MNKDVNQLVFNPSDLVRYVQSPFASWMERLCLDQAEKKAFLVQQASFNTNNSPDPFEYKEVGDWSSYVVTKRHEQDHLSSIANITRSQIKKLKNEGIYTCAELIKKKNLYMAKMPMHI